MLNLDTLELIHDSRETKVSGEKQAKQPIGNMHRPSDERGAMWLTGRRRRDRYEDATKLIDGRDAEYRPKTSSIFPFVPVQLKRLTKTHPCRLSVWRSLMCLFLLFSATNDSAGSSQMLEWSRHCPNFLPKSPTLLFTHNVSHAPRCRPCFHPAVFHSSVTNLLPSSLPDLPAHFQLNLRQAVWKLRLALRLFVSALIHFSC